MHLATNFQNMFFDLAPENLRAEMYAWLNENHAGDRKAGMTDEQFYYKTRKYAIGPFKEQLYSLPETEKEKLSAAWEKKFSKLFDLLGVAGTRKYVEQFIQPVMIQPALADYVQVEVSAEDVSDLAD